MKKGLPLIVLLLICGIGILVYFLLSGAINKISSSEKQKYSSNHQGHATITSKPDGKPEAPTQVNSNEAEAPAIEISPEKQHLIGVKTTQVTVKPLKKIIRTVGRIEYDERRLSSINTKFEGWIEKLHVDYTGKYVNKGDPLAEIYSPELIASQHEFIDALRWRADAEILKSDNELRKMLSIDAEKIISAAKKRLSYWDITEEQIKKIEQTKTPLRTITIHSPVSGYVVQKMAVKGMRVMPGEKLFDIADLSSVWIISEIYEYELSLVRVGMKARIALSYLPKREFLSTIEYVYPELSGDTRTARVRFTLPNPNGQLKPKMFTNVEIKIDLGKRLVIPKSAVIDTGMRKIVYVDKGEGYFEPREVLLGLKDDENIEVLKGLQSGENVVSSATFLIDSESKLKGVIPLHTH